MTSPTNGIQGLKIMGKQLTDIHRHASYGSKPMQVSSWAYIRSSPSHTHLLSHLHTCEQVKAPTLGKGSI